MKQKNYKRVHKICNYVPKKVLFLAVCCLLLAPVFGQIKMNENGNVSIGSTEPQDNIGLYIRNIPITSINLWGSYSHFYNIPSGVSSIRGFYANASSANPVDYGTAIGIIGQAQNYRNGFNYGVFGRVTGEHNGAGILGTRDWANPNVPGQYAGYFRGNVHVTGQISGWANSIAGDERLFKDNISSLQKSDIEKLMLLNPVVYQFKPEKPQFYKCDTTTVKHKVDPSLLNRDHIGFIAQEFEKVYPDLVYKNDHGVMSINYTGLIPVLVEAFKGQQMRMDELYLEEKKKSENSRKIQDLEERIAMLEEEIRLIKTQCCQEIYGIDNAKKGGTGATVDNEKIDPGQKPVLYQNNPNPFNQATTISFTIPESAGKAMLYIYDMQGVQIRSFGINERGHSSIKIQGAELQPGMYLYTLIADGREVDTKRMILTK